MSNAIRLLLLFLALSLAGADYVLDSSAMAAVFHSLPAVSTRRTLAFETFVSIDIDFGYGLEL